jgi:C4-dicarboxylate-specific signal transduction histidine kinase
MSVVAAGFVLLLLLSLLEWVLRRRHVMRVEAAESKWALEADMETLVREAMGKQEPRRALPDPLIEAFERLRYEVEERDRRERQAKCEHRLVDMAMVGHLAGRYVCQRCGAVQTFHFPAA